MRHSIRYRFTLIFVGLLALMLLAIWVTNNWCLETFYINEKVKVLEKVYVRIDEIVEDRLSSNENIVDVLIDEIEQQRKLDKKTKWNQIYQRKEPETLEILNTIREYREKSNIKFVMIDTYTGTVVRPFTKEDDWLAMKVQFYTLGYSVGDTKVLSSHENYRIEKSYDPRSRSYFLESWGFFSDDRTLYIMSMPISSIQDSVALSNRFLSYVGVAVLLIGCVLMYFTTRKVTMPIMKLAKLSEDMSHLNFEAQYEGNAIDEIGVLGYSMNTLSDKLKDTIEDLRNANHELQKDIRDKIQIDEIRKEFIGNVSHELKTPIALIQGYAEGLTEGMCENEESRKYYCEVIVDEAKRMNRMVCQLLNLTALEFGNDNLNMEYFDIVAVIREFILSANILIQQNEAKVVIEVPDSCFVWADGFKIEEVLSNYLTNAMNHLAGERIIRIQVVVQETDVKVSVFNTGDGIPNEVLSNIWTKFYKVDQARTREYGGIGIGLSIVKAIVEAHHKAYGANNKEDGVEFWFTLDLEKNKKVIDIGG